MRQLRIRQREQSAEASQRLSGLHPVLRRVYAARQVSGPEALRTDLASLADVSLLGGTPRAAELLAEAICQGRRILVVGDFDADGATSVAVFIRAMRMMGAQDVHYLVPNRFDFGYGLTPPVVELAARQGAELLVTVDNGISSLAGVEAAVAAGMRVIVTDHHLPGPSLPAADAIVNPNLPGDPFPSKTLAGVGVIFYVLAATRALLRERGWFSGSPPQLGALLDLVALGTVADVVALDGNNRVLVEQGLRRIRAGQCCPGIHALLQLAGRDPANAVATDLGFAVGPRLNAAGRLEDMSVGIECLLTDDPGRAEQLAAELDQLNRQRRDIEQSMEQEALAGLEQHVAQLEGDLPAALCVFDQHWHQGVVGIVASRLRERFHRPTVVFAPEGDGALKGSGRSIPGLHLRDALERIDTLHPGLISRFGGHAAAAGLTLHAGSLERFSAALEAVVREWLEPHELEGELLTDGPLEPSDIGLELAMAIRQAGPWGQGFPEPLFDNEFTVLSSRIVGERHLKLSLRHPLAARPVDAIAFRALDNGWRELPTTVRAIYRLDLNHWRGTWRPQLVVEYIEASDSSR
ncbi:MAG: single-stranded-DNA-specific exonuclease RecJ [Ectothiorhodospiraceae bacterium]|nr:single-stranded-DNA-specific exonuclease RecJ [Ectothiorhodospiraceae bacterium]MCH8505423.1 single-stranded-DNA-specific exonuclease RecJ [Ectothiorhodospiraceae bacterium]